MRAGIALTTCTVPGTAPSTRLAGELIEIGMGIHGEPGLEQCVMRSADELAQAMIDAILTYEPDETLQLQESHVARRWAEVTRDGHTRGAIGLRCPGLDRVGDCVPLICAVCGSVVRSGYLSVGPQQRVVVLLNNLGGTPPIEVRPSKATIPSIAVVGTGGRGL